MTFLSGIAIRNAIEGGRLAVDSLDPKFPFRLDQQVTEDAIDLRMAPFGIRYRPSVKKVDYLEPDLEKSFETFDISADTGYLLHSGKVLFTQTLEVISLPADVIGMTYTRSTYARLGMMVTLGAPKSPGGIRWAIPLQIANLSGVSLIIYPYSVVAQLMLVAVQGSSVAYQGRYQDQLMPTAPFFNEREKSFLKEVSAEAQNRTIHIFKERIAQQQRQLQAIAPVPTVALQRADGVHRAAISRTVQLTRVMIGVVGAGAVGGAVSIATDEPTDHWRLVSAVLLAVIGLSLVVLGTLLPQGTRHHSNEHREDAD